MHIFPTKGEIGSNTAEIIFFILYDFETLDAASFSLERQLCCDDFFSPFSIAT